MSVRWADPLADCLIAHRPWIAWRSYHWPNPNYSAQDVPWTITTSRSSVAWSLSLMYLRNALGEIAYRAKSNVSRNFQNWHTRFQSGTPFLLGVITNGTHLHEKPLYAIITIPLSKPINRGEEEGKGLDILGVKYQKERESLLRNHKIVVSKVK